MTTPSIQPLADRILLKAPPKEEKKEMMIDGIIIPEGTTQATIAGIDNPHEIFEVVAAGEKVTTVKTGDRVVIRKVDTFPVQVDKEAYPMVREQNVVAIVR